MYISEIQIENNPEQKVEEQLFPQKLSIDHTRLWYIICIHIYIYIYVWILMQNIPELVFAGRHSCTSIFCPLCPFFGPLWWWGTGPPLLFVLSLGFQKSGNLMSFLSLLCVYWVLTSLGRQVSPLPPTRKDLPLKLNNKYKLNKVTSFAYFLGTCTGFFLWVDLLSTHKRKYKTRLSVTAKFVFYVPENINCRS